MNSSSETLAQSRPEQPRTVRIKILHSLHENGLWNTLYGGILFLLRRVKSWRYDVTHHVDTRHDIPLSKLDLAGTAARHALHYEATHTNSLRAMLNNLNIAFEKFEFVDLGAGKGRSLLIAAEFPFQRITGVELSPTLSEVALNNCKVLKSDRQACRNFEVVCGDASEFRFPDSPVVIFFFNPFGAQILSPIVQNLEQSWEQNPREIVVVYHHPVHGHLFESSPLFSLSQTGTDRWDHRKLRYKIFRSKAAPDANRNPGRARIDSIVAIGDALRRDYAAGAAAAEN